MVYVSFFTFAFTDVLKKIVGFKLENIRVSMVLMFSCESKSFCFAFIWDDDNDKLKKKAGPLLAI